MPGSVLYKIFFPLKFFHKNIVARWSGSSHDSTIFFNSSIYRRLEANQFGNGLIVGDDGYAVNNYLLTPLLNPLTRAENL